MSHENFANADDISQWIADNVEGCDSYKDVRNATFKFIATMVADDLHHNYTSSHAVEFLMEGVLPINSTKAVNAYIESLGASANSLISEAIKNHFRC